MANDESALREVEQALDEDRQLDFIKKNGPLLIGAAAALVLGVAGSQFWNAQQKSAAEKSSVAYRQAIETLAEDPEAGRAALEAFVADAPGGYKVLADLRRAGSLAAGGERLAALDIYRSVYANGAAPSRIKQLARLRAGFLSLEDGRDAVLADVGELENDPSVFGFYAQELVAVAALDAGDYETAKGVFERLAIAPEAPAPLRQRAEEFAALASAGKAGASLTTDIQLDDLSQALGAQEAELEDAAAAGVEVPASDEQGETGRALDDEALAVPPPPATTDQPADGDQQSEDQEPNE